MAFFASLRGLNLFTSLPSSLPQRNPPTPALQLVPIPIPIHKPEPRKPPKSPNKSSDSVSVSRSIHDEKKIVIFVEHGSGFLLHGAPFPFQYNYSEVPKEKPISFRYPTHLPFTTHVKPRPWTGNMAVKKRKKCRRMKLASSSMSPPPGMEGVKVMRMRRFIKLWDGMKDLRTREEILGDPLTEKERNVLRKRSERGDRQLNLGREGVLHNSLDAIHSHWMRSAVCRIRCKGVPTVDMDNMCSCLEEKTGGKVIHRVSGTVYLFRGRNYDWRTRPKFPLMLRHPPVPRYPNRIPQIPEGLTKDEADELRRKGKELPPFIVLGKNGVYSSLVKDVRDAFEESPLVKIGLPRWRPRDAKKLGVKLKELVPAVLLCLVDETMLIWRGKNWKSSYPESNADRSRWLDDYPGTPVEYIDDGDCVGSATMGLWKEALESGEAFLLEQNEPNPDGLPMKLKECME